MRRGAELGIMEGVHNGYRPHERYLMPGPARKPAYGENEDNCPVGQCLLEIAGEAVQRELSAHLPPRRSRRVVGHGPARRAQSTEAWLPRSARLHAFVRARIHVPGTAQAGTLLVVVNEQRCRHGARSAAVKILRLDPSRIVR